MLFNSAAFLWFFPIVWSLFWLLRAPAHRTRLLLAASLFFYGWWDWRFLGLMGLSIVVDYFCGRAIGRAQGGRRRAILAVSLGVNLGVLALYKYFDFFSASASELLGLLGFELDLVTLHLVLPLGISFYTFQTLAYTIDVYRGEIEPCRDPILFATYVSFFPQLVAGPIERANRLLPQLARRRKLAWSEQRDGLFLVVQGFFKKLVVADNLGFVVDYVFGGGESPSSPWLVALGAWAFAFQIYGDFSGYSDIARGLARCLGVELMENFRAPYMAQSPQDFWRRWHVSLSTWLRDYLYVSLGGNRRGRLRTYANLETTMLLGGLWHGAAWTFVVWGAFHGTWLALHRIWRRSIGAPEGSAPILLRALRVLVCFQLVTLAFLVFRAESLEQVVAMLATLGGDWSFDGEARYMSRNVLHFAWPVIALQVVRDLTGRTPAEARAPLVSCACSAYMLYHVFSEGVLERGAQFIYFQF